MKQSFPQMQCQNAQCRRWYTPKYPDQVKYCSRQCKHQAKYPNDHTAPKRRNNR